MANFKDIILAASEELGTFVKESTRSLILKCPQCSKPKLYFDKEKGNFNCFTGSCGNKGKITKLLSQMKGISYEQAANEIFGGKTHHAVNLLEISIEEEKQVEQHLDLPVALTPDFLQLDIKESLPGINYLLTRGLNPQFCKKLDIRYSPVKQRIIFPIKNEINEWVGYQARSIDSNNSIRMLNNQGFRKGKHLMFLNEWPTSDFLIVAEGPVDALKFSEVGGFIATLGKDLSRDQIELLNQHPAKTIYWALDEDADNLIPDYARMVMKNNYRIKVIPQAKIRISNLGKKADFGECTPSECTESLNHSENLLNKIFLNW